MRRAIALLLLPLGLLAACRPASTPPTGPSAHALGVITVGESRLSGDKNARLTVFARFFEDATARGRCREQLEGCELEREPHCADACSAGESCTLDDSCHPVCAKRGEPPSFDAGPIHIEGATRPFAADPPYDLTRQQDIEVASMGGGFRIRAEGAKRTGFEKFDASLPGVSHLRATPPLALIAPEQVFGDGPLRVAWEPGLDDVGVVLFGHGGQARCIVRDRHGSFDVPRSVIDAVSRSDGAVTSLLLGISRYRTAVTKQHLVKGEGPREGWLELSVISTELTWFRTCSPRATPCGDACIDPATDPENCGACGHACGDGRTCREAKCVEAAEAWNACVGEASVGACKTLRGGCRLDTACARLMICTGKCETYWCREKCEAIHADGLRGFTPYTQCVESQCSRYAPK